MREIKAYDFGNEIEEVCPNGKLISCETSGTNGETIFSNQGVMGLRCGNTMIMCNGSTYYATGSGTTLPFFSVKCPNGHSLSCAGIAGRDYEAIYDPKTSIEPIGLRCGYEYMFCNGSSGYGSGHDSGCCGSGSGCCGSGCSGFGSGCCDSGCDCGCSGIKNDKEQEEDTNLL